MFKKTNKPSSGSAKKSLSQYGLFDIPDNLEDGSDLSGDDDDLEAELAAISGGGSAKPKAKPKPDLLPPAQLNAMIAESLRDIPSDEDVSGDEDDPDILGELQELTLEEEASEPSPPHRTSSRPAPPPPSSGNSVVDLLQERITNYSEAENNAKANGESSRARRFNRGLKTLTDLLKQAQSGKAINEEDIPPQVSVGKQNPSSEGEKAISPTLPEPQSPAVVSRPAPSIPSHSEEKPAALDTADNPILKTLLERRAEYRVAALEAKHANDKEGALTNLKIVKQLDQAIELVKSGQTLDINNIIPQGLESGSKNPDSPSKQNESIQSAGDSEPQPPPGPIPDPASGLITASTVKEALEQHLAVYKEQEAKAKEQNNSSKARRMGRIIKQYETALKQHAAGKPVAFAELPTPPGFAPPPGTAAASPPEASPAAPPAPKRQEQPATPQKPDEPQKPLKPVVTRADKQLTFLLQRQKEFKEAALEAKKRGEIEQAKDYLRKMKGFDSVIEAAQGGLAVDLDSLPLPPQAKQQLEDTFEVVASGECDPNDESGDILSRLEEQLNSQLKLCMATCEHNRAMANIPETNRFERLAMSVKQDLDVVKIAKRLKQAPPKFHFEMKQFSVVQCNTDLNENDLELSIVRGVNYNVDNPKEVDTYVRFEFPYPQETPVINKTSTVYNTNNPDYNAVFPLSIQRSSRACQRVFKRHAIKLQVYSKGGIFYRDVLLGACAVKLQPLENHVTIHEAFPLMDGRKATGGSVEVKVRVRNPILAKQIDNKTHKWLVIDHDKS